MENKIEKKTLKEIFNPENFDPLNIDVSEFQVLSDSMPKDTNLDAGIAEQLAGNYLRAADKCSEILSSLILLENNAKTEKNKVWAKLFLQASDKGYKTAADKNAYADAHEDFIKASEFYNKLQAVKMFFEMKHESFLNGHRLMKDKFKSEMRHLPSSGFNTIDVNDLGEKKW